VAVLQLWRVGGLGFYAIRTRLRYSCAAAATGRAVDQYNAVASFPGGTGA